MFSTAFFIPSLVSPKYFHRISKILSFLQFNTTSLRVSSFNWGQQFKFKAIISLHLVDMALKPVSVMRFISLSSKTFMSRQPLHIERIPLSVIFEIQFTFKISKDLQYVEIEIMLSSDNFLQSSTSIAFSPLHKLLKWTMPISVISWQWLSTKHVGQVQIFLKGSLGGWYCFFLKLASLLFKSTLLQRFHISFYWIESFFVFVQRIFIVSENSDYTVRRLMKYSVIEYFSLKIKH